MTISNIIQILKYTEWSSVGVLYVMLNKMKLHLRFLTILAFLCIGQSFAEVIRYQELSWSTDAVRNKKQVSLSEAMLAHLDISSMSTEELAKRCSVGIRISVKHSHFTPTQIVILENYKSHRKLQPFKLVGWREYSRIDTTAMTLNRTTKVFTEANLKGSPELIKRTKLWSIVSQDEIPNFKHTYLHGEQVTVELFSTGSFKLLEYANASSYSQKSNLHFRTYLHELLTKLGIETSGIVYLDANPKSDK